jgi:hypothetical protein
LALYERCRGQRQGVTTKYLPGAAGVGLGTTIKYLRHTTRGAAGNSLGNTGKYLRRFTSGTEGNGWA